MSISKLSFPQPPLTTLDPDKLSPYVDPLPIPQIAQPSGMRPSPEDASVKLPYYRMAMRPIECKVHRDLPATRMWGFGTSSPGPTFETRSNHGLIVEWVNELPRRHFLPIDHTLHGAEANLPEVRSVIHLHGGKTPPFTARLKSCPVTDIPGRTQQSIRAVTRGKLARRREW